MQAIRRDTATALQDFVSDPRFPCVGAKAALSQGHLDVFVAGDLRASDADESIVEALATFAESISPDALFASFCATFPDTPPLSEAQFEDALWQRLQAFHEIDRQHWNWDPLVGSDPRSPDFGMSLGGHGFYVVGLHPHASRPARRFDHAAMAFNLHRQFDQLRAEGRYEKLRGAISARDAALSGSVNPMLAPHGVTSEAPQYSGRVVGDRWTCPFKPGVSSSS
jgi:uncharacterized protein